jgi:hypothetical protein
MRIPAVELIFPTTLLDVGEILDEVDRAVPI